MTVCPYIAIYKTDLFRVTIRRQLQNRLRRAHEGARRGGHERVFPTVRVEAFLPNPTATVYGPYVTIYGLLHNHKKTVRPDYARLFARTRYEVHP